MMSAGEKRKGEKGRRTEKKRKTSGNGNVGDFRDFIYPHTQILFPASSPRQKDTVEKKV